MSEAESDDGLRGWLAPTRERFFLLPGRHSPLREYPRAEIWQGKASLKIRFPLSKIGWHVQITWCYTDDFQQRFLVSAMPAPATARLGRLPTQGDGDATAQPNAMGPNVPTIEGSGRC